MSITKNPANQSGYIHKSMVELEQLTKSLCSYLQELYEIDIRRQDMQSAIDIENILDMPLPFDIDTTMMIKYVADEYKKHETKIQES